jgi:hypothetical protein
MSPVFVPIILAILIGLLLFVFGLIRRKKWQIAIGCPAVLLVIVWLILASLRPNPDAEFTRVFGSGNRLAASEIKTIKPAFMDGHFISFRMSQADFDSRILPQFTSNDTRFTSLSLLHRQKLPNGWPKWIESSPSMLTKVVDNQTIVLMYGTQEKMAYASVEYEQW